ncbi:hypothetical protein M378DRAFT_302656 [Amanita muscaria Koide BX008]|uniref:Uncharacterized protein n=1 Tax=Amanita muscaria (strain Koide BX008) TaxID=946122 RepID=A0A0C2XEU2_AMAMK|nr:hypothetical protein M378DRAFT_302656 [Amanita muscaria Koide BX008]
MLSTVSHKTSRREIRANRAIRSATPSRTHTQPDSSLLYTSYSLCGHSFVGIVPFQWPTSTYALMVQLYHSVLVMAAADIAIGMAGPCRSAVASCVKDFE